MNEPNTLEHYLNQIQDEEIRVKALKNTSDAKLTFVCQNISDAIMNGFVWVYTPEGHFFWNDIYDKFEAEEKGE